MVGRDGGMSEMVERGGGDGGERWWNGGQRWRDCGERW